MTALPRDRWEHSPFRHAAPPDLDRLGPQDRFDATIAYATYGRETAAAASASASSAAEPPAWRLLTSC